jgi:hypothetical protein
MKPVWFSGVAPAPRVGASPEGPASRRNSLPLRYAQVLDCGRNPRAYAGPEAGAPVVPRQSACASRKYTEQPWEYTRKGGTLGVKRRNRIGFVPPFYGFLRLFTANGKKNNFGRLAKNLVRHSRAPWPKNNTGPFTRRALVWRQNHFKSIVSLRQLMLTELFGSGRTVAGRGTGTRPFGEDCVNAIGAEVVCMASPGGIN